MLEAEKLESGQLPCVICALRGYAAKRQNTEPMIMNTCVPLAENDNLPSVTLPVTSALIGFSYLTIFTPEPDKERNLKWETTLRLYNC